MNTGKMWRKGNVCILVRMGISHYGEQYSVMVPRKTQNRATMWPSYPSSTV